MENHSHSNNNSPSREANHEQSHAALPDQHDDEQEPQRMHSPPVAPARIMDEARNLSQNVNAYPVATLLKERQDSNHDRRSSLVRQSRDQQAPHDGTSTDSALPWSVRSVPTDWGRQRLPLPEFPSAPNVANHHDTSVADSMDDQEYIIVEGDLIQVPPQEPNHVEQESLEDAVRRQLAINDDLAQTCQPKKVRRGVRKLSKWFKKRHKKEKKQPPPEPTRDSHSNEFIPPDTSISFAGPTSLDRPYSATSLERPYSTDRPYSSERPYATDRPYIHEGAYSSNAIDARGASSPVVPPSDAQQQQQQHVPLPNLQKKKKQQQQQQQAVSPSNKQKKAKKEKKGLFGRRRQERETRDELGGTGLDPPAHSGIDWSVDSVNSVYSNDGLAPLNAANSTNRFAARPPAMERINERVNSVTASFVGMTAGMPTEVLPYTEYSFEDEDEYDKKMSQEELPMSLVADQADLKVDKADAPDVEAMLRRAMMETNADLHAPADSDCLPTSLTIPTDLLANMGICSDEKANLKVDTVMTSVPLSEANRQSLMVHNDILKVVMVSAPNVDKSSLARKLRNSNKGPRPRFTKSLACEVSTWRPYLPSDTASASEPKRASVNCMIWDVQGASSHRLSEMESNFGAHPGTQSLFFSPQSLYLLVWDLGVHNSQVNLREVSEMSEGFLDDDSDDEEEDEFIREEANRQADRALRAELASRVISWFDVIATRGRGSAILPVALIPETLSKREVERRCGVMQQMLEEHFHSMHDPNDPMSPKLLTGTDNNSVVAVKNFGEFEGIGRLQEMVIAVANDPSQSVFGHIGNPVPYGTVVVREAIQRFKEEHKLILLDHLIGAVGNTLEIEDIIECLNFLASIGDILYFGSFGDEELSRFVILSHKWLVSTLSCILRNDWKRELADERRFMNMQCIYSDQKFEENEVIQGLVSGRTSNCPLVSNVDAKMLWQSRNFMREASDRFQNLLETSTGGQSMFYFLERLLIKYGVFIPLETSGDNASLDQSEVFFVPSLLAQADPENLWTYRCQEAYTRTLCHSWLFRDGARPNLMEDITVGILSDLYSFSKNFQSSTPLPHGSMLSRAHSLPVGQTSYNDLADMNGPNAIGRVRIHHVMCFKSTMLIKIGTLFTSSSGELRESFVEVFVAIADQNADYCVASDVMRPPMQRVIVSGKGQDGNHGRNLWKGGYDVILKSVRRTLSDMSNVDAQVVCPMCLESSSPCYASTWGWDSVLAVASSGNPQVICVRGHRVNSNLICGKCTELKAPPVDPGLKLHKTVTVQDVLPSVVLVAVWNPDSKEIVGLGSGFVADKKSGLIVTAAHVVFDLKSSSPVFGKPYLGYPNARAVIGLIPEKSGTQAVFRYFADIVASDCHNVDAAVLQIRSRLTHDVQNKDDFAAMNLPEKFITDMATENLQALKMKKKFELEESVRLIGYNQEGEKRHEIGKHVALSADFVSGYICRHFKAAIRDDSYSSDSSSVASVQNQLQGFTPREEIVVMCMSISGHSGGPCINNDGKVLGILSRSDPAERQRCYLVPAMEIKPLIVDARRICARQESFISSTRSAPS